MADDFVFSCSSSRKPRPIAIEGDIGLVSLTQGRTALIDASDASLIGRWNWQYWKGGGQRIAYAARKFQGRTVRLHNVLLPPIEGMVVDHIDCDPLNNRRSNLRYVTQQQNRRNRDIASRIGRKGVYFQKSTGTYAVRVHIGEFLDPDEAAAAYDRALLALFPEHGRPNASS